MESFNIAFSIGSISVPWHAIVLVAAVLAAVVLTGRMVKMRGLYRDLQLDLCILCIPLGLIGGRLFSALSGRIPWDGAVTAGVYGLNLYGAMLFCFVGIVVYCRIRKFRIAETLDVITPGVLLAIGIGRWQDFFLCDGVGYPVQSAALKFFPLATVTEAYFTDHVSVAYAIFFYEFLICVALAVFAVFLVRHAVGDGNAFALSMLLYGFAAFFLEIARDPAGRQIILGDLPFNGLMSFLVALAAFCYLLFGKQFACIRAGFRTLRPAPEKPAAQADEPEEKPEAIEEPEATEESQKAETEDEADA